MSPPIGLPRLTVTSGTQHGASFEIAPGRTVIGRGVDAGIVLHDASISRRHAAVDRDGDRVTLVDLGSANGTRINRRPAAGAQALRDGDVVRVGAVDLVFGFSGGAVAASSPPSAATGLTSGQRTRAMVFAGLTGVVALLFESVRAWFMGMGGPLAWLAVGAVAAAGGIVSMLLSLGRDRALRPGVTQPPAGGAPPYQPPSVPPGQYRPPPQPARRRVSPVAVVFLVLLVCGAGGAVITPGVLWAVDQVQGLVCPECERGEDWLVEPVAATAETLTVTVTRVEVNSRVIKVSLTTVNGSDDALTLDAPSSTFTTAGRTFRYDGRGDFTINAVPRVESYGTFVYSDVPPRSATEADLSLTNIFFPEIGFRSLTIGIQLNAP